MNESKERVYREDRVLAQALLEKEQKVKVCGVGNSMTPLLKSRQSVMISSFKDDIATIRKGDIVFCKVNSYYYLHKVYAIKGNMYQIGNNHGHINGWTNASHVYGKVVEIL